MENIKCEWSYNFFGKIVYCKDDGELDTINVNKRYFCGTHMLEVTKARNKTIIQFLEYTIKNSHLTTIKELLAWLNEK